MMKRITIYCIGIMLALGTCGMASRAQEVGASFSFFFPKNGYFSNPVAPLSLRGIGVKFGEPFAITTGFTLYRIAGMNVRDLPFTSKEPLMGPFFSLLVPLEAVITLPIGNHRFRVKGGGFIFFNFDNKFNLGNLDRALKDFHGWEVVNGEFDFKNNTGTGVHVGAEYIYFFKPKIGISLKGNYFLGNAKLDMEGSYTGGTASGGLQTLTADFPDARLDFTGLELAIGVIIKGK